MTKNSPLLEAWKAHPTRRAELAALLQEPALAEAIAIVREQTFLPKPIVPGQPDMLTFAALTGSVREGYLEMLFNFLSLARISPFALPERKPWETPDPKAALEAERQKLGGDPTIPPV